MKNITITKNDYIEFYNNVYKNNKTKVSVLKTEKLIIVINENQLKSIYNMFRVCKDCNFVEILFVKTNNDYELKLKFENAPTEIYFDKLNIDTNLNLLDNLYNIINKKTEKTEKTEKVNTNYNYLKPLLNYNKSNSRYYYSNNKLLIVTNMSTLIEFHNSINFNNELISNSNKFDDNYINVSNEIINSAVTSTIDINCNFNYLLKNKIIYKSNGKYKYIYINIDGNIYYINFDYVKVMLSNNIIQFDYCLYNDKFDILKIHFENFNYYVVIKNIQSIINEYIEKLDNSIKSNNQYEIDYYTNSIKDLINEIQFTKILQTNNKGISNDRLTKYAS